MSAVQDVFILVFVLECDEKVFGILRYWDLDCANDLRTEKETDDSAEKFHGRTSTFDEGDDTSTSHL